MPTFTNVLRRSWFTSILQSRTVILLGLLGLCQPALTQEISAALIQPASMESSSFTPSPAFTTARPATLPEASHRFWDRENTFLFATSAAFNTADFVVTRDNLRGGGRELNPVTRVFSGSTPGLVANFAGETAGVVALSYFFHKTGHHRMERFTSILNIGSSAGAVTFDLVHR
jgi:hypothetical protein